MWIIPVLGLASAWLWHSNKRRAQRFIRSVFFLELLEQGLSANEANGRVALMFTKHSTHHSDDANTAIAIEKSQQLTEGKQLPWIHQAREKGFIIDSGNTRLDLAHHAQETASRSYPLSEFPIERDLIARHFWRVADICIGWALIGAIIGVFCGLVVPPLGPLKGLEIWAVPFLFSILGSIAGVLIGTCYRALRWLYSLSLPVVRERRRRRER